VTDTKAVFASRMLSGEERTKAAKEASIMMMGEQVKINMMRA
jgi:hypothetical protein